jgi:hypothetical protein
MLGPDIKALFELYGEKFVNALVARMNNLNLNASGSGAKSIKYRATQRKLSITSKKHVEGLDRGLFPSDYRGKKPSTSNNGLERWVKTKMRPDLDGKDIRRLAFAVAATIKRNGTIKRFRYRGADLIGFVIKKQLKPLANDLGDLVLKDIDKAITLKLNTYKNIKVQ